MGSTMLRVQKVEPALSLTEAELAALPHEKFMRKAIQLSAKNIEEKHGGCFGALVVDGHTGEVVGEGYNHVISECDPTWHGEMQAIREACKKRGSHHLHGCVVYTSAEPCPMCYCACMWARVSMVYYAATYQDVKQYGKFEDADFLTELHKAPAERGIACKPLLRDEAVEVWKRFAAQPAEDRVHY